MNKRKKKLWSKSFGKRGNRVRVFEARSGGNLMRAVWINGKEDIRTLGHKDKQLAERQAYELLAQRVVDEEAVQRGTLTLAQLQRLYTDSPAFADKKERTRREDIPRLERMVRFLGPSREVQTLSESDVRRFTAARQAGDPALYRVQPRVRVRTRSIEADLVALHTMLNWGARERDRHGQRLISENPLRGVAIPREKNPVRPLVSQDEYEKLLEVSGEVNPLLSLALVIAEGTGRRLSAFRRLRWSDIDLDKGTILWRSENDKKGYSGVVPVPEEVRSALREAQRRHGAIGEAWVFPSPQDFEKPCRAELLDRWLRRAYERAGLEPKPGGLWHPFRRKWATDRKEFSPVDVAAAGGWRNPVTPQRIYQQADQETMREVMEKSRRGSSGE